MHNNRRGKLMHHAASLKLAASSGQYILHPTAIAPISQRNPKSARLSKNVHWSPVDGA